MNKRFAMVGVACALLAPMGVQAQAAKKVSVGVSGGLSMPLGDFGDVYDPGFAAAGHVYFTPASAKKFRLRGDVSFDRWQREALVGSNIDVTFTSFGFTGNLQLLAGSAGSAARPYVLAGGGMYRGSVSRAVGIGNASLSSTDPGVQGGAGIEFALSGFSTFAEVKVVNVFGDGSSIRYVPVTFGVRF